MNTLKKFIHYYGPYKTVFFIDLLCAAIISLVDLAYPQILRSATKTLFTQDKAIILQALPWIAIGLFMMYVIQSLCKLCQLSGTYHGSQDGEGYAPGTLRTL
mgnify:CR=1 FL=1